MMIDYLESIDRSIVLAINGWHSPIMDEIMWTISGKTIWIPLYVLLIMLYYRRETFKKTLIFLLSAILVVGLADLISAKLIKELVLRARPSHNLLLTDKLHFYRFVNGDYYKGGEYGFVSSHAANFFGLFTFVSLVLRYYYKKVTLILMIVATLVCFSRIYLGVHYLSDIIFGGLLGALIAYLIYRFIFIAIIKKEFIKQ